MSKNDDKTKKKPLELKDIPARGLIESDRGESVEDAYPTASDNDKIRKFLDDYPTATDNPNVRKLDESIPWTVKEYIGVEVLTAPPNHTMKEVAAGTWPDWEPEPITEREALQAGQVVLVSSLMGGLDIYNVELSEDGKLLLRNGGMLGVLDFGKDDRNCWICTGVANLKAITSMHLQREMTEQDKLERAIRNAHRVVESREDKESRADALDVARWLKQLHAVKFPPEEKEPQVINLDDHRIRKDREFEGEQILYIEALFGKETFAYDIAIRDIEKMRQGTEDPTKPLRPPKTDYEIEIAIKHIRWLANEVARLTNNDYWVRPEDDAAVGKG